MEITRRKCLCALGTLLIVSACSVSVGATGLSLEDQSVFEVLLASLGTQDKLVTVREISTAPDLIKASKALKARGRLLPNHPLGPGIYFNFSNSVVKRSFVTPSGELRKASRWISAYAHEVPRSPSEWLLFYKRFPKAMGVIRLSVPAYSSNGQQAVVALSLSSSFQGGSHFLYLLEKRTRWEVLERTELARS